MQHLNKLFLQVLSIKRFRKQQQEKPQTPKNILYDVNMLFYL